MRLMMLLLLCKERRIVLVYGDDGDDDVNDVDDVDDDANEDVAGIADDVDYDARVAKSPTHPVNDAG